MRVALIGRSEHPAGREQAFTAELCAGLERAGVSVSLVSRESGPHRRGHSWPAADILHLTDASALDWCHRRAPRSVLTCDDARLFDTGTPAGDNGFGERVERWRTRRALLRASALVCTSDYGLERARLALGAHGRQLRARIYPAIAGLSAEKATGLPGSVQALALPYVLHLSRENAVTERCAVLDVASRARAALAVVFAGAPLERTVSAHAAALGLSTRMLVSARPDSSVLSALYRHAHCSLLPAGERGVVPQLLEAQARDCPVVAGAGPELVELARSTALLATASDADALARQVDVLFEPSARARVIAAGRANAELFRGIDVAREYLAIYAHILTVRPRGE